MKLKEEISKIRSLIIINENVYLRRRVTPEQLNEFFEEALSYASRMIKNNTAPENYPNLERFSNLVISLLMDEIHPYLIEDGEEFPYDDIMNFLKDKYQKRIWLRYVSLPTM